MRTPPSSIPRYQNMLQRSMLREWLFLESKLFDKILVSLLILAGEILQVLSAICHHLEQSASGMKIFLVLLKVLRELINLASEQRNLCFRRSGIGIVTLGILNSVRFFLFA